MKKYFLLFGLLLCASVVNAQAGFIQVTAKVVDPQSFPYSNGTVTATILPTGLNTTINGVPFTGQLGPAQLDLNGVFNMTLADNTLVSPAGTKWNFHVCANLATVQWPIGTGSQCFDVALTIHGTGTTQDISTSLNAVAPSLTNVCPNSNLSSAGCGGVAPSGCSVTGFADQSVLFIHPLSTCAVDTNLLWDPTSGKQWLLVGGPAPIAPFTFDNFSGTTDNYLDWGDTAATFARQRATGSGANSCILCIVSEQNSGASVSGIMPGITIVAVDNSKRTAGGDDAEGISIFSAGNFTSDSTNANVIGARVEADISGGTSTGLMNVTGFWSHASHTVGQSPSPSSNSEATEYYAESIAAGDFKLRTGMEIDFTSQTSNPALDTSSYCGLIIGAICNATGNTDGGSWALYVGGVTAIPIKNRSMFNGNVDVRGAFNQTAGSSSFTGGSFSVSPLALTNPPAGPNLTPAGGGATTWGYKYVAIAGDSHTAASAQTTTTAAATLDVSHTITINCPSLTAGALNYDIYRTTVGTSPSTTGFIGRLNASCLLANGNSLVDNGLTGDGTTAPTTNNTGSANFVQAASTIHAIDIYSVPLHVGDLDRAMLVLNCVPFGSGDGCNGSPGSTPTQFQIGFDGDNIAIINSTGNQVAFTQETVQFFGQVKLVDSANLTATTLIVNPSVVKTTGDLICGSNDASTNCTSPVFELVAATGFTQVKRINAHEGTALVSGDFALGAGWGSTAAVSAVTGTDQAFNLTITTGGSGIAANPTTTLTFHDGTWTNSPIFTCSQTGGNDVLADITFTSGVATATTLPMIWNGTPTTAKTYIFSCVGMGR